MVTPSFVEYDRVCRVIDGEVVAGPGTVDAGVRPPQDANNTQWVWVVWDGGGDDPVAVPAAELVRADAAPVHVQAPAEVTCEVTVFHPVRGFQTVLMPESEALALLARWPYVPEGERAGDL